MKLTLPERETILLFNEGEPDAEIYTFNEKLKHRLAKAAERHPEIYKFKNSGGYGSVTYTFPKKWLTVSFREPISEERRNTLSESMRKRHANQG